MVQTMCTAKQRSFDNVLRAEGMRECCDIKRRLDTGCNHYFNKII